MSEERIGANVGESEATGSDNRSSRLDRAIATARARPESAEAWVALGEAYMAAGQLRSVRLAPRCFTRAIELEPGVAVHWARLGKVLLSLREHASAQEAFRRACAIDPGSAQWLLLLGAVCIEQNDIDAALSAFERARRIAPESLQCAFAEALLLPPVYRDAGDVVSWRSRYEAGLGRLRAELSRHPTWHKQILGLEWNNFSLAHQGGNDRALQEQYAEIIAELLANAVPELQEPPRHSPTLDGRIRVGFLSSELRTCTIGDYFSSWILGLPREQFDVRCYFTGYLADDLTAKLAAASDHFETLSASVETTARRIRLDAPDILIFPDVGMSKQSYLFANLRLAPVQCAAWGHPVTTGSAYIDHYISCADMEPTGADAHYREKLLLLPGLGVRYARPPSSAIPDRAQFGLPREAHLYICPNRLHKFLPDRDEILMDILSRDPRAALVFFDTVAPGQRDAFSERLQRGMRARDIAPAKQIKFLPAMPRTAFLRVLAAADVMLDCPNFSGGSSALDALASGLPIVAQEGRYMRGRQSAAMLRLVGLPELVATDDGHYVELALRVVEDRAYRASLSGRIAAGLSRLFDRSEPIDALARALEDLARHQ